MSRTPIPFDRLHDGDDTAISVTTDTYLGLLVQVHALLTQQLVTVDTLAAGLPVLAADQLADVAKRELAGLLSGHHLAQAGHQEVVRQLLDASNGQLSPLAAEGTSELSVVGVLQGIDNNGR